MNIINIIKMGLWGKYNLHFLPKCHLNIEAHNEKLKKVVTMPKTTKYFKV